MTENQATYGIRIFGDPVLRRKADEVRNVDAKLMALADGMLAVLGRSRGLGLAAPQVGRSVSLCIINLPAMDQAQKKPLILLNPRVAGTHGRLVHQEGCLSFPELYADIARPKKIGISGLDLEGREIELEADEMLARCFLHEIDHLNGVLFIDHLSHLKRQLLRGQLRRIAGIRGDR
ncbi:MAG TPA: peptide deformylase [candidate division Zixibacteria bacterium]|jgi:peptide deformylase|nr:peptide deformylase [candidate division Zixibacteria bacterium]